jgi:hypothetical protein
MAKHNDSKNHSWRAFKKTRFSPSMKFPDLAVLNHLHTPRLEDAIKLGQELIQCGASKFLVHLIKINKMKKEAVPHILSKLPDNLVQGYQQEAREYEQTTCLGHQPEKVMELTSDAPPPRLVDSAKDSIDKESSPEGKSSPLRKLPEGEEVRLGLSPGSEGEPVESGHGTKRK